MGVTAIDDDVALLEVGDELSNELVNRIASLDEKDDFAGTLELGDEFLDRPCTLNLGPCIESMCIR